MRLILRVHRAASLRASAVPPHASASITAIDPIPGELRQALEAINGTR